MAPEFAPQYTVKERRWRLAVAVLLTLGAYALCQGWFLPWLHAFSARAECESLFGMPGLSIVFYGLFVCMPLTLALAIAGAFLPTAVRSARTRRYPPPGKKVYRPTKIKSGWQAVVLALAPLIPVLVFVGIAVWGCGQATRILERTYAAHPHGWQQCAADGSMQPSAVQPRGLSEAKPARQARSGT